MEARPIEPLVDSSAVPSPSLEARRLPTFAASGSRLSGSTVTLGARLSDTNGREGFITPSRKNGSPPLSSTAASSLGMRMVGVLAILTCVALPSARRLPVSTHSAPSRRVTTVVDKTGCHRVVSGILVKTRNISPGFAKPGSRCAFARISASAYCGLAALVMVLLIVQLLGIVSYPQNDRPSMMCS